MLDLCSVFPRRSTTYGSTEPTRSIFGKCCACVRRPPRARAPVRTLARAARSQSSAEGAGRAPSLRARAPSSSTLSRRTLSAHRRVPPPAFAPARLIAARRLPFKKACQGNAAVLKRSAVKLPSTRPGARRDGAGGAARRDARRGAGSAPAGTRHPRRRHRARRTARLPSSHHALARAGALHQLLCHRRARDADPGGPAPPASH